MTTEKFPTLTRKQTLLVLGHAGLVAWVARRIYHGRRVLGEDVMQEGNVGLVMAAHRFDPSKGANFKTYAIFWIRAKLLNQLYSNRSVVSLDNTTRGRRVFFNAAKARKRAGAGASLEAVAAAVGDPEVSLGMLAVLEPMGEVEFKDWHAGLHEGPEGILAELELGARRRAWLTGAVAKLSPRDQLVLRMRRRENATLREVGAVIGLSRERVRQIEKEVLEHLRRRRPADLEA